MVVFGKRGMDTLEEAVFGLVLYIAKLWGLGSKLTSECIFGAWQLDYVISKTWYGHVHVHVLEFGCVKERLRTYIPSWRIIVVSGSFLLLWSFTYFVWGIHWLKTPVSWISPIIIVCEIVCVKHTEARLVSPYSKFNFPPGLLLRFPEFTQMKISFPSENLKT